MLREGGDPDSEGKEKGDKQAHKPGPQETDFDIFKDAWRNPFSQVPREKEGPRNLVSIQGSPSPSLSAVPPNEQEVRQKQRAAACEKSVPTQVQISRDDIRQAKTQMELNRSKTSKDKKGFCKYIGDKNKTRENVGPLLNEMGDLVMKDRKF